MKKPYFFAALILIHIFNFILSTDGKTPLNYISIKAGFFFNFLLDCLSRKATIVYLIYLFYENNYTTHL